MSIHPPQRPEGSQSIVRAVELLDCVASRGDVGIRLSQVVAVTGLNIATARRILQTLVVEGLLVFDSKDKIYTIGPAIYSYAAKSNSLFSIHERFIPLLDNIAQQTQDTVLLSLRSGFESVCLARREGAFPIRVMSLQEGSRRPLGAGSGSLAILAFLPDPERAEVLKKCEPLYVPFGLSLSVISKSIIEARKFGFSFNPGHIIDGVFGIGVPILKDDQVVASISVAAIESRMDPKRRLDIVAIIRRELSSLKDYSFPLQRASDLPSLSRR